MRQLLIVFLSVFVLYSCNKDEALTETTENVTQAIEKDGKEELTLPTVRDGRLVFECAEKMEEFIHVLSENDIDPKTVDKTYGYESYLNYVTPTEVNEIIFDNERFAAILNKDGVVEIGGYVFKINPATEQTFAIKNTAPEEKIDGTIAATSETELSSLTTSEGIVFSFDDNAFDLLKGDANCERFWDCGEDCARRRRNERERIPYCTSDRNQGEFILEVRYRAITIVRWAYVDFVHNCLPFEPGACDNRGFSDIRVTGEWRRKCRAGTGRFNRNYVCDFIPTGFDTECFPVRRSYRRVFYEGWRCLSRYRFVADARLWDVCDGTNMRWTDFVRIEDGF